MMFVMLGFPYMAIASTCLPYAYMRRCNTYGQRERETRIWYLWPAMVGDLSHFVCSLGVALSWSFSPSVVPGKCHQNMRNREKAESRKLPGRGSGFSRKGSRKGNFMNKATKE